MPMGRPDGRRARIRNVVPWFLLIPFVLPLCVPLYARNDPMIGDVPFFVWFQLPLVLIGVVVIALVYRLRQKGADGQA
jgi:hypothetical protein